MPIPLKSQHDLQAIIAMHYSKNELYAVIQKTTSAMEMCLTVGYNTYNLLHEFIDIGVRRDHINMAMAVALSRVNEKFLTETDKKIKKEVTTSMADMIQELEEVID